MQHQRIVRLYAGHDGESHFEDIQVTLEPVEFAPPAPPVNLADLFDAASCSLVSASSEWDGGEPHPTPRRQLFAVLSGKMVVTASDGESRQFPEGSLLLLEDTTGEGHVTRIVEDVVLLSVALGSSFGVPES